MKFKECFISWCWSHTLLIIFVGFTALQKAVVKPLCRQIPTRPTDTDQYRPIPTNTDQYRPIPTNTDQYRPIPTNTDQYRPIPTNTDQYRPIPTNTDQYRPIPTNTDQYRQITPCRELSSFVEFCRFLSMFYFNRIIMYQNNNKNALYYHLGSFIILPVTFFFF